MLESDPALRRLEVRSRLVKYPFFASLVLFAAAIVLSAAASTSWLLLLAAAAAAWMLFARLAVNSFRDLHQSDYEWRLGHAPLRERTVLELAKRAVWPWTDEVPDEASHAVLVADEIGGPLRAEAFLDWDAAQKRVGQRVDLLGGEQKPVVVALVELEAGSEPAVIEVAGGRIEGRRPLLSLPEAADGWLVGV